MLLLWHRCLKNVKHEADDTSDHVQEAHAGAKEKNIDQRFMEYVQI